MNKKKKWSNEICNMMMIIYKNNNIIQILTKMGSLRIILLKFNQSFLFLLAEKEV